MAAFCGRCVSYLAGFESAASSRTLPGRVHSGTLVGEVRSPIDAMCGQDEASIHDGELTIGTSTSRGPSQREEARRWHPVVVLVLEDDAFTTLLYSQVEAAWIVGVPATTFRTGRAAAPTRPPQKGSSLRTRRLPSRLKTTECAYRSLASPRRTYGSTPAFRRSGAPTLRHSGIPAFRHSHGAVSPRCRIPQSSCAVVRPDCAAPGPALGVVPRVTPPE